MEARRADTPRSGLATLALLFWVTASAQAGDTYWQAGTGDWFDGTNWTGTVPTASDAAYIDNGGTAEIAAGNAQARELGVGHVGSGQALQTGGTNTVAGHLYLGHYSGSAGTYTLSGTGQLTASTEYIGRYGTGAFAQSGGMNAAGSYLYLGRHSGSVGRYTLSGTGQLSASREYVGRDGTGAFAHSGGVNAAGSSLYLGYSPGSVGTYTLSGTGRLSAWDEYIGRSGTGGFLHIGGTNAVGGDLYVGYNAGPASTYALGGTGQLSASTEYVGRSGTGAFAQSGGTNTVAGDLYLGDNSGSVGTYTLNGTGQLSGGSEYVGRSGMGAFAHSGGTNTVADDLYLGYSSGSVGTYTLSGSGRLSAQQEYVGRRGTGRFVQTGGVNTVSGSGELWIGAEAGGDGHYDLQGGELHAETVEVGVVGRGVLAQSGGAFTVDWLTVGPTGTYRQSGGVLALTGCMDLAGAWDLGGSAVVMSWDNVIVDVADGVILGGHNASLTLGPDTLAVVSPATSLSGAFGTYTSTGMTHLVGTTLIIPVGKTLGFPGRFDDPIVCEGEIRMDPGEAFFLNAPLTLGPGARADLGLGGLTVDTGTCHLTGGELMTRSQYIGDTGSGHFVQPGGSNTTRGAGTSGGLLIGKEAAATGTYELHGGTLTVDYERVGWKGEGHFIQTGGIHHVVNALYVSMVTGSTGTYELHGGWLRVPWETVGGGYGDSQGEGRAHFIHTGGVHAAYQLLIGYDPGSTGLYELSGDGRLAAQELDVGYRGVGEFIQSGGICEVQTVLSIGAQSGAEGTYTLSGTGRLQCQYQYVGDSGRGSFRHVGGDSTVETGLYIGRNSTGSGVYELGDAGLLSVGRLYVGHSGSGEFRQSGGVTTVSVALHVASGSTKGVGAYALSGGALGAPMEYVGDLGSGTFDHSAGTNTTGLLSVGVDFWGRGTYELGGSGRLDTQETRVGGLGVGTFVQSGGVHAVSGRLSIGHGWSAIGTYEIGGGQLQAADLVIGGGGLGRLHISSPAAEIAVSRSLCIGAFGYLEAGPSSVVHMTGAAFENRCIDPAAVSGLSDLALVFEGGPVVTDSVEAAGRDLGADLAGWANNFALGTLQLGGSAAGRIRLVDDFDNQPGWAGDEALYAAALVMNAGASLDPNGLNLYYLNGGGPKLFLGGDADLDGAVNVYDLADLANNYGATGKTWAEADFDGDGSVNVYDLAILANGYGSTTAGGSVALTAGGGSVPEPTVMVLVCLAAAPVLLKRRRNR